MMFRLRALRWHNLIYILGYLVIFSNCWSVVAKEFLPPEQAFVVEATWVADANELLIDYRPAKGYYIYQESLQYRLFINNQKIYKKNIQPPRGVEKFDETFGKKM